MVWYIEEVMNRLTDMEFDEISLVSRPANQLSKVVLYKSDNQETDVSDITKGHGKGSKGMHKMPDGSMMADEDMEEEVMEDDEEEMMPKGKRVAKGDDTDVVDLPSEVFEYISALEEANADLQNRVSKAEAMHEEEDTDIMKSADPEIVALVKSFEERATAAEAIAKSERNHRLDREFISKASVLTHLSVDASAFGKVLKSAAELLSSEQYATIWNALEAANTALAESQVFSEVGKSGDFDNESSFSNIDKAANKLLANNPEMTREQAISKSVQENPSLYTEYLRGK